MVADSRIASYATTSFARHAEIPATRPPRGHRTVVAEMGLTGFRLGLQLSEPTPIVSTEEVAWVKAVPKGGT